MAKNYELSTQVAEVKDNLDNFIDKINCLSDTFVYSEDMLVNQLDRCKKNYNNFIRPYASVDNDGNQDYNVPTSKLKEYKRLHRKLKRAEMAFKVVPPTYIVSLVSLFDSFFAGLVRCAYVFKPDLLLESNKQFVYREIAQYESIKEIKSLIIDAVIDNLLRESHTEQFKWLEKAIGVDSLRKFSGWEDFIELTERRNLFVHSDGVVSFQYIRECGKSTSCQQGIQLSVDKDYFAKSYKLVYKMGVILTQILLNKLYKKKCDNLSKDLDSILINNIYELIYDEQYDIAIDIAEFILTKSFTHNAIDNSYIQLNLAQAYKWSGDESKCRDILERVDTTTWNNDLLIPKLALQEDFKGACELVKKQGSYSEILTKETYREWPIFKGIRKTSIFQNTFKEIFGEELLMDSSKVNLGVEENNVEDSSYLTAS